MVKKIVPVIALLAVLGGVYKFVLAKPAKAEPKPHVQGTVYMLQKEFLINLADGRFAKMQIGLVLAHDDTSTVAAGGHETSTPPEGYGAMSQEGIVRDLITAELTDATDKDLIGESGRDKLKEKILKSLKKYTDVKVEHVLFSDLTVQ
ncbi:flagellar basal body-associated FliL family protein [Solirubrobacter ginsenosidimutans]|uniref:Flagellar protein FliL n=1 Tax=Solirubrobacter ginsenosidimutans TaxID=490573 RepID=A0A9X3MU52_9ACTN|nr:flagellar basal body-associated FliL family protein [Solirubrobacter ginsenosidimutans]MDA0161951.1 flagellar basal body-associated FliL family protein [Solirubrobacter ginsenosidimutans]